jgi:hypothetical protein
MGDPKKAGTSNNCMPVRIIHRTVVFLNDAVLMT